MKKILFLSLVIFVSFPSFGQLDCDEEFHCRVTAPSGMRLRGEPNTKAKVVGKVPYDSLVAACTKTFGSMTYEDLTGHWRKVNYKGKVGYMFDGFLEVRSKPGQKGDQYLKLNTLNDSVKGIPARIEDPKVSLPVVKKPSLASSTYSTKFDILTEAYNYCGDVQKLDPTLLWYGFYQKDDESGPNIRILPIELEVVMSKTKVGKKMEFDIETDNEEHSIFLLGLNRPLETSELSIKDNSEKLRYAGRKVFPGQEFLLSDGLPQIKLSATGSVTSSGPCPELKEYKLLLKGNKYDKELSQDITAELLFTGQCGMPEIYWYGDFTGDGVPEIIFVSVYEEKNHFTLFLSDPRDEKVLLTKQSEWIIDKCY